MFSAQASDDCTDLYPSFVCHAFWAKFACANKASGFYRKCRQSCGKCDKKPFWPHDESENAQEESEKPKSYDLMSRELQKLEALLAHYYLKLERSFILNSIDNKIVLTEGTISSPLGVGERSLVRVTVQTDKNLPKFLFF